MCLPKNHKGYKKADFSAKFKTVGKVTNKKRKGMWSFSTFRSVYAKFWMNFLTNLKSASNST
jgi:hypothetical protein